MTLHGYKRPGTGYIHGDCFGVSYAPFELSKDGTVAYVDFLEGILQRAQRIVAELEKRDKTEMDDPRSLAYKLVKREDINPLQWKDWEDQLIRKAQASELEVKIALRMTKEKLSTWELKPLPGIKAADYSYDRTA
jgi:hypothetical protein